MKNTWFALIILLIALTSGCQQETSGTDTPIAPTIANLPPQAESTTLVTLLRNPAFFDGSYIQLSGQYKRFPLMVCSEAEHSSPATWALVDGSIEILASGFDSALRRLADPGLPLIVEGRWQQWEGPVGCGRRAPVTEIWYLDVNNIVSPNPLTIAQSGMEGIASLPIEPTPQTSGEDSPIPGTSPGITSIPTATPSATSTRSISVPTASPTGSSMGTPFLTPTATTTQMLTATSTSVGTRETATTTPSPTATTAPGAATSTPAGASGTPGSLVTTTPDGSATADPSDTSEPIDFDDLFKETLAAGEVDSWSFLGEPGDVVSIGVSPTSGLDVSIELIDPNGSTLVSRNQGPSGQVENISQQSLNMSGIYEILIRSVANSSGDYAVALQTVDSQPFMSFQGNIAYGESRSNTVPLDVDDMWNFLGTAGDVVTIRLMATGNKDLVLYLNDPDAFEVEFVDDNSVSGPPNDEEIIDQFTLQKSGLFSIGIGEGNFEPFGYTLTLEKQS